MAASNKSKSKQNPVDAERDQAFAEARSTYADAVSASDAAHARAVELFTQHREAVAEANDADERVRQAQSALLALAVHV